MWAPSPAPSLALLGGRLVVSPGLCGSLRRLLMRDPAALGVPLVPFVVAMLGGCLNPGGGLLELSDGDGDD